RPGGRRATDRQRHRRGTRERRPRAAVQRFIHDEARRHGLGLVDQPLDHRGARRPALGGVEHRRRRELFLHVTATIIDEPREAHPMRARSLATAIAASIVVGSSVACGQAPPPTANEPGSTLLALVTLPAKSGPPLTVTSPAFKTGGDIPFEN